MRQVDMHVHSRFSSRPSQWILKKLGCPESFTEPAFIYERARAAGMDFVTITDHNVIDGALEIAHLPGAFVSEEVTAHFPADKCKVHVLVYDITEGQHREIQRLRENVFDLSLYLRRENLLHVLAHPLFAVNDKLRIEHFEQCLLLFDLFEANGCRDALQNTVLERILADLDQATLDSLANRHNLAPAGPTPWKKGMIGGSDDHSGLNIASMRTLARGENVTDFLASVRDGAARPAGTPATGHALARNLYSIAYQYYQNRSGLGQATSRMPCMQFAERMLGNPAVRAAGLWARLHSAIGKRKSSAYLRLSDADGIKTLLLREATRIIEADPGFSALARGEGGMDMDREWFRFVGQASDKLFATFLDRLLTSAVGANIFDVFSSIGTAGSLYALLAPYFVSFGLFARERSFSRDCARAFGRDTARPWRLAHFTDTFEDINGVSGTIRQQLEHAREHDMGMTVVTCGQGQDGAGIKTFEPVGRFSMPEYPELSLFYPPFLAMLEYSLDLDPALILAATPGPVGLAALGISRILRIPIHGTYHTVFPQYVASLTGDASLEEATRTYMSWFYKQMDVVYAPSQAIAAELEGLGVEPRAIRVYPRGVDTERFDPAKRNGFYGEWTTATTVKLLYVGRVSREKDLDVLATAFRQTCRDMPGHDLRLIVVGDGPYRAEMEEELAGLPVLFTGVLDGEDLAEAYASADLFVFPSTTDTFGNVVLEAQASGLPVIVSDQGGPRENIEPGETGVVVAGRNAAALARAMVELCSNPGRIKSMGERARAFAEQRTFGAAFLATWDMYQETVMPEATGEPWP
jgi:glycosyltransferase involved in cell wall biosynthesis